MDGQKRNNLHGTQGIPPRPTFTGDSVATRYAGFTPVSKGAMQIGVQANVLRFPDPLQADFTRFLDPSETFAKTGRRPTVQ